MVILITPFPPVARWNETPFLSISRIHTGFYTQINFMLHNTTALVA